MAHSQITCITLSNTGKTHEHITHVGQRQSSGPVRWTVATVVNWIETGIHTFYVQDSAGRQAEVRVVKRNGLPSYLRTVADGYYTDNLLSLTSCPI